MSAVIESKIASWGVSETIAKITRFAVKNILSITEKSFATYAGHKIEQIITLSEASNDNSLPQEFRKGLKIGDYYFSDGQNAFHIQVV